MAKKCFIVSVELEEAVWAENAEEAKRIAKHKRAFEEGLSGLSEFDMDAHPARHMPGGYDDDSYVYGSDDDGDPETLKEALERTPEYVAAMERHQQLLAKVKEI